MYLGNIIKTFISKAGIIVISLLLVILTTHLWGREGRGLVSILLSDIALITIINNILGGSSLAYFTPKEGIEKLILPAYLWILIMTPLSAIIINSIQNHGNLYSLIVLSTLSSFFACQLLIFTGKENLKLFNFYSFLSPFLTFVLILILVYVFNIKTIYSYNYGFGLGLFIVIIFSALQARFYFKEKPFFSFQVVKKMMNYGLQTETSNFLQFLNYRLSYYFILYYMGINSVGLFSVGIAIAESIWTISRSIATVQYARIINNTKDDNVNITKTSAKLSFISSFIIIAVLLILPPEFYAFVFGKEFFAVKKIIYCLFPGVLLIATSTIHGHYFSATGQTKTLVIKSLLGVGFTIAFSFLLIPKWGITGACIATTLSYIASSGYLIYAFYSQNVFSIKDIMISKSDFNVNY